MKPFTIVFALLLFFAINLLAQAEIYVSDAANFQTGPWQILKFDEDGKNGKVYISEKLGWPQDILFLEDQKIVLISNFNSNRISKYDINTGVYLGDFTTNITTPTRMKIGKDGLLYVLQWQGNGKVKRFDLNGNFIDDFTSVGVTNAIGIDWDDEENLYISSYNGGFVQKFDKNGVSQGKFITVLAGPTNIYFGEEGSLFVLDYNVGIIKKYDQNGKFLSNFITNVPQCEGITFLDNGNILVGVGGSSSVRMYNKDGIFIKDIIPPQSLGLITPNAVVLRNKTNVVHEEAKEYRIFKQNVGRFFKFSDELETEKIISVSLLNIKGELVMTIPHNAIDWSADTMDTGTYFVKIINKNSESFIQKIFIQ